MKVCSEAGEGPTVVFVHGAGVAGWMWKKQEIPGYRRVVVDLADHGTDRQTPFRSIEAEAETLGALLRSWGEPAHLVGHSLGAKIVLEILVRAPEWTRSAVVSSALVRPSMLASMMNSHALNVMSVGMLRWAWLAKMQARQFAFGDGEMEEQFVRGVGEMQAENLDRPIAAFCAQLFLPPGLEAVACPVLVTTGSRELGTMQGSADDIVARIPKAKRLVISGAQHNYPWTHAQPYNAALQVFWQES